MAQEGRVPLPPCPAGPQAAASVRHRPLFLATPLRGGLLLKAERARGRRENVQSPWTWVGFAGECRRLAERHSVCGNSPQRPWELNTRPFPFPASVSATVK